jgi:hypothetical protein
MPEEELAIDLKYLIKSNAEAYERNVLECQLSADVGVESEYRNLPHCGISVRHGPHVTPQKCTTNG